RGRSPGPARAPRRRGADRPWVDSCRPAPYDARHGATAVTPSATDETVRVDVWLWAVRLLKTRALATAACKGGHVRINGRPAKPATPVRVGDRVEAHVHDRDRVLEVVRLID